MHQTIDTDHIIRLYRTYSAETSTGSARSSGNCSHRRPH
jgi:hypothetical protein